MGFNSVFKGLICSYVAVFRVLTPTSEHSAQRHDPSFPFLDVQCHEHLKCCTWWQVCALTKDQRTSVPHGNTMRQNTPFLLASFIC